MPPAIKVENLGKEYVIGSKEKGNETFREMLLSSLSAPFRRFTQSKGQTEQEERFWALKDVSFEVQPGEVVGIIGRNGAGKSTLLKILSRITEPTQGEINIRGRVASLLEVGTGFHPELTGRENIYLNGAILGMSRAEIKRKFDEIVDFSEVEKFLDTPVKRYSSGMYVRLAFAVAAHLEPEILVVDEVLAVGDAQFQKKCLGKMGDVAKEGRTVLFVSHNMAAVQSLCGCGLVLGDGVKRFYGSQTEAINYYLNALSEGQLLEQRDDRMGSGVMQITQISFFAESGQEIDTIMSGQNIDIVLRFRVKPGCVVKRAIASIAIRTSLDTPVFLQHNRLTADEFGAIENDGAFRCRIRNIPLPEGSYSLTYSVMADGAYLDMLNNAVVMNVVGGDFFGSGEIPSSSHGVCLVNAEWALV